MAAVSPAEQYQILQTSAGLADLSSEEVFTVTGDERVDFLNNYNSQDVKKLPENGVARGTFQTQKGKLVGDAWILKLKEKILLLFAPGFGAKVRQHLDLYLSFAEADFEDTGSQWDHWVLLGPKAAGVLQAATGASPLPEKNSLSPLSREGEALLIFPTERFGMAGWELLCAKDASGSLREDLLKAGVVPVGKEVLEVVRVEAGLPKMGVDMGEDNLVAEVGLDKDAVSFNKGCYLGQETTARVQSQGHVNRRLVRWVLKKPFRGSLPLEVFQGESKVGRVTSVVDSVKWKAPLALGIVQTKALKNDEPMTMETREGEIEMEVVATT